MENCSFHSQLVSVMEVLARAAVEEINRRVDDGCAVLRRDVDLLKRKCELMETELRRNRMRARRKVFSPPAAERFSPLVKIVMNKDRQRDTETQSQPQQCAGEAERVSVKEECAEEDAWKSSADKLTEQLPCFEVSARVQGDSFVDHHLDDPGSLVSPLDAFSTFTEQQQLNRHQSEAEFLVKQEPDEPDENAAPLDSVHKFEMEDGDGQLWTSGQCADAVNPRFSPFAGQQFEAVPTVFQPQSGLHLENMVPQIHSEEKLHSVVVSAAPVKRRARAFGRKRLPPDTFCRINTVDQCSVPGQSQHQNRDPLPHTKATSGDQPPNTAMSACGRSNVSLARRMRTPWRSGIGEKRFGCTYCDKNFMRFSQLKEHLRSHTGEKPFSCLQCGRSFTKQCNLIRHAVVHSGEKPYECSLCGKCFTQRSSLKSHQKTAH